jgi:hypothetical protein
VLSTDPIDFMLNTSTGDVVIPPVLTTGVAAVVQGCRIAMATIAGEWFLDLDQGVPYFERVGVDAAHAIFGQKYDQAKALVAFRAALLKVAGVLSISTLTVTFDGPSRSLTVLWAVKTAFGDTPVDTLALGV